MKKHIIKFTHRLTTLCVTGFMSLISHADEANPFDSQEINLEKNKAEQEGSKCAAGKCGGARLFEQANIDPNDIQDKPVKAYDGKCGMSGNGLSNSNSNNNSSINNISQDNKGTEGICATSIK